MSDVQTVIDAFNRAWNDHDLDAAIALTSPDCVFESTGPAPDGERAVGADELRRIWGPIFADANARFETEELLVLGDDVVQRWRYDWGDGHVRGIDVMTVRDGLVTRKLSYVKG